MFSIEQIREAGRNGEISPIDVEHLIAVLQRTFNEFSAKGNNKETIRKLMTSKFPTSKYFQCPVPEEFWEGLIEYADQISEWNAIDFAVYATDKAWFNEDSLLWELHDEESDPFRYDGKEFYQKFLKEQETNAFT